MLHRISKTHDINAGKWIGVGGHFEDGESPEECLLREVYEETGITLTAYRFHGIVTFVYRDICEYMFLYTASEAAGGFPALPPPCREGVLEWVDIARVPQLALWEGDRIFLRLLAEDAPVFSLKLVYRDDDSLAEAFLNGRPFVL